MRSVALDVLIDLVNKDTGAHVPNCPCADTQIQKMTSVHARNEEKSLPHKMKSPKLNRPM